MATLQPTHLDLEAQDHSRRHSTAASGGDGGSDVSIEIVGVVVVSSSSSDEEEEEEKGRESTVSDFSVVDLESGGDGAHNDKVHLSKIERDCRICHLSIDLTNQDSENGIPIELGCSCKDDLAAAHKHCAEAWFKIKGNKTCEICGSIAHNVAGANEAELMEQWNEANDAMSSGTAPGGTTNATSDNRNFWQGHRFLNFLLACMVFAFVISWLFHFNVPS
ncbi:putative Zinc finger, RING-CH-type, Zinc finger, RING/FYVE/PHD-type [Helianthus annuus]|nr:putative Zinc finger, RING-CH-type, Zinc finger, RING/FYVE/PHD-type [Helianthus annuus]